MGIFTHVTFNSLEELLEHDLRDLYDAEHRITEALPMMAEKASSPDLKAAFEHHLEETERQIQRLESAFHSLGVQPERKKCEAMVGLIKEGSELLDAEGDEHVLDAALIAAAQRVEHYEIAGYGSARTFAIWLDETEVADLLQQTLNEEGAADRKLTEIAETVVNPSAV